MFFKAALFVLATSALVAATMTISCSPPKATQCNTGSVQCCNSITSVVDPAAMSILGALGVVIQGVGVLVELGCTPITIIGAGGGATCAQQPVCCQDSQFNGLINVGCTPISL